MNRQQQPAVREAGRWIACAAAVFLGACSSPKTAQHGEYGPTFRERMSVMDKIIKHNDFSMRSSFEKEMPKTSLGGKTYSAKTYHTNEVAGIGNYAGAGSTFHVKDFSESGRKNRAQEEVFAESGRENPLASRLFRTSESSYNDKASPEAGKTFTNSGKSFATRENRAAAAEMAKNKKPVILDQDKPTYSEDEVKRLLNKS